MDMRVSISKPAKYSTIIFYLLAFFICAAFALGGSARDDVQSLVFLRPIAALGLGIGLWLVSRADAARFRVPIALALACLALPLLQLVPLPPAIWAALPGHEADVQAVALAGIAPSWRPISLTPARTLNSVFALFVPLAAMVLAIVVPRERRFALLPLLIALGLASGVLGLLQVIGAQDSGFYLYRITNNGSSVGLFANRNHQALMLALLFPMLAVFASTGLKSVEQARVRGWIAIGAGALVLPLLLVTGSRSGVLLGAIGLASIFLLYRRPEFDRPAKRKARSISPRYWLIAGGAIGLLLVAILLSRAPSLDRLVQGGEVEDMRLAIWGPIAAMAHAYFPFGSGIGSFVETYQAGEPRALLSSYYFNHAHNDWLEASLTGGVFAILLMVAFLLTGLRLALTLFGKTGSVHRDIVFARLGMVVLFIFSVGSVFDYPGRVPSLAALCSISMIWITSGWRIIVEEKAHSGEK